jgi:hypothetical protein
MFSALSNPTFPGKFYQTVSKNKTRLSAYLVEIDKLFISILKNLLGEVFVVFIPLFR